MRASDVLADRARIELAVVHGVLADDAIRLEAGGAAVLRAWKLVATSAHAKDAADAPEPALTTTEAVLDAARAHLSEKDIEIIRADLDRLARNPYACLDRAALRRHAGWLHDCLDCLEMRSSEPSVPARRAREWLIRNRRKLAIASAAVVLAIAASLLRYPRPSWRASYFPNVDFSGNPSTQLDTSIDFDWSGRRPRYNLWPSNYSVRWESCLALRDPRPVAFALGSDDGSRLYVDGQLVIDDWGEHGFRDVSTWRTLPAGGHRVRVDYYQGDGPARVRLRISARDGSHESLDRFLAVPRDESGAGPGCAP
jgi:hypothetical protein